ncbi:MAG: hypothetical protein KJ011_15710 [Burkholderiaceae bacterium]|nr:hypothetical protein [Burkholderiaceae bacterium]
MTGNAAHRTEPPCGADSAAPLRRGVALLEAQRAAMVGGDPDKLAAANADLDAWLAGLSSAHAARPGSTPQSISRSDAATMRAALEANAAVAQRAAASAQRALAVLLPQPAARTYDADGRPSDRASARTSIRA